MIAWSADDASIATVIGRRARVSDASGELRHAIDGDALDARFADDGTLVVLGNRGPIRFDAEGRPINGPRSRGPERALAAGTLAADGSRYVAISADAKPQIFVGTGTGTLWTFQNQWFGIHDDPPLTATLSPDGRFVAIGYTNPSIRQHVGRGWVVIRIESGLPLVRAWQPLARHADGAHVMAFDAAGARLVHATPEPVPSWGVVRVARDDAFGKPVLGGAITAAIDRGGTLAAYAYPAPPPGARGRLRVDYLAPESTAPTIAVLDSLSIEPALADVVAVAFSRDSRSIACVGSDSALEVVPVP